jgi:inorganic pyrophosphatase/exopolyphosphatase
LIFLDDVLSSDLFSAAAARDEKTAALISFTLVDHNALTGELLLRGWGDRVIEIVDHHEDAGAHSCVVGDARLISWDTARGKGCGSACSLVSMKLSKLDKFVAGALCGVIALDCINFDDAAGKTTRIDTDAVARLTSCDASLRHQVDSGALFAELSALRTDSHWWLSLAARDALRLDCKVFEAGSAFGTAVRIGTCAMTISLSSWLDASDRGEALADFATENRLSAVALFSLIPPPAAGGLPRRQFGLYELPAFAPILQEAVRNLVGAGGAGSAWGLAAVPSSAQLHAVPHLTLFSQEDHQASRKQMAPRLVEAVEAACGRTRR